MKTNCPNGHPWRTMRYIFPAPQLDTCAEFQAWRFQRCTVCWWSGDVKTGKAIDFARESGLLIVDGAGYPRGLAEYLVVVGICQDDGLEEKG